VTVVYPELCVIRKGGSKTKGGGEGGWRENVSEIGDIFAFWALFY